MYPFFINSKSMVLEEYATKLKTFDLSAFIMEVLVTELKEYLKELQQEQMDTGIDSQSKSLGEYAESTIGIKKRKGQPYDRVTLKDTGSLYDAITTQLESGEVAFDSIVDHTKWVTKRYSEEVFGLNEKSIDKLNLKLIPIIQRKLYELLD